MKIDKKIQKAYLLTVLIEKYYEENPAGGTLHIVLDDGNYGESFVKYCMDYAIGQNDYWGEHIAALLLGFTEDEQEQIIERPYEIYTSIFG